MVKTTEELLQEIINLLTLLIKDDALLEQANPKALIFLKNKQEAAKEKEKNIGVENV